METVGHAKTEFKDPSLLLSSLHLLVPPLQLMSAAMWQVVQQKDMMHYGKLEEFVSLVMETVPELLSDRQRTQLNVGLRERTTGGRMASPVEIESKTDTALQVVLWELLSRLEQLLPVPDLKQTVSWLSAAPSVLEECVQSVCKPQQLKTLLQLHTGIGHISTLCSMDECNLSTLSHPHIRRVDDSTKLTDPNSQPESEPDSVSFSSPAFPCEHMKAEPVINSIDYTGVCLKSSPDRSGNIEESKNGYGMSREEKDILSNIKEEDEGEERQSVMMETEDGVRDEERLWREQENEKYEQRNRHRTDQSYQSDTGRKNAGKSECEKQEGEELSTLVTSCLLKQPRVLICRCDIKDISLHPHSISSESVVRSPWRWHDLLPMSGRRSRRGQCVTWKNKSRSLKQQSASTENRVCTESSQSSPVISLSDQNTGYTEVSSQVFSCSQCPFIHDKEVKLEQHIEKVHPEEHSRILRPGGNGAENPLPPSSTHQHPTPPKTLPTPTQSPTGTPGVHTCSHCGKNFRFKSQVIMHERTHTGERPFQCSQCGKSFTRSSTLVKHQQTHTGESPTSTQAHAGPHACSQCEKSFMRASHLRRHQMIHTGEHPYQCSLCGKSFRDKSTLKTHIQMHTGERPFQCSQCGKGFMRANHLKRHQEIHSGENLYQCSLCGKSFGQSQQLKFHLQGHTGERPYQCSQCGKSFVKASELKRHQVIHTGENLYQCSLCGKSFTQSQQLKLHLQGHTGERPYQCSQCWKGFLHLAALQQHRKIHTDKRPYHCLQCRKSFRTLYTLQVHQRNHTGERPYQCSQCGKNFSYKSLFKKHLRTHTEERPYHCSQCGKRFKRSHHLTSHKQIHTERGRFPSS